MSRALSALVRLRHIETDLARRDLADRLAEEAALLDRDTALAREVEAARTVTGAYDQQAFAAFLARVRGERERLAVALREVSARVRAARADLAARRMAETSAGDALAEARAGEAAEEARRDQATLEDVARALRRRG